MRQLISVFLLMSIIMTGHAFADGRVFPPDNCTSINPFMAFNGVGADSNTYCINGQNILSNALPTCGAEQEVAFNGSSFYCRDAALPSECGTGEFLTFRDGAYSCGSTSMPTCGANQVLTFNGSSFLCVTRTDSIPTCAVNQFLTYNGTSFQCANTQALTIPNCPDGQVLTGSGGSLTCVPQTALSASGSWCGYRDVAGCSYAYTAYGSRNIPCNGMTLTAICTYDSGDGVWYLSPSCPAGYSGVSGFSGAGVTTHIACVKN